MKFINKSDNKNNDDEDTEIDSANYTQDKNEIDEETEIDSVLSSSNNKEGNNKSKTKSLNDDSTECEESNLLNDGITKNVRVKRKKRRRKSRRWAKKVCAYNQNNQKNVCNGQVVNGKVFDKETLKKDSKNKYQTKNKQSEDESVQNIANGLDGEVQDMLTEEELSTNELNENIESTETNLIDEIDEITQNTENDNDLKPKNELIIDKTKVNKLFDRIIDVTKESSVEELEKLHSNLLKITLKRKNEWDKNGLIKVNIINKYLIKQLILIFFSLGNFF